MLLGGAGGAGNDMVKGGAGLDVLRGGGGSNVFEFDRLAETKTAARRNRIAAFTQGDDLIDVSGIDAVTAHAGNDAFQFIGSNPFSGHAGELRRFFLGARTIVASDANGDGSAEFQIALLSDHLTLMNGALLV